MGLDSNLMVENIVSGASGYLVEFLPIGAFIIGFALALVVIEWLFNLFLFNKKQNENSGE